MDMKYTRSNIFEGGKTSLQCINLHNPYNCCICPKCGKCRYKYVCTYSRNNPAYPSFASAPVSDTQAQAAVLTAKIPTVTVLDPPPSDVANAREQTINLPASPVSSGQDESPAPAPVPIEENTTEQSAPEAHITKEPAVQIQPDIVTDTPFYKDDQTVSDLPHLYIDEIECESASEDRIEPQDDRLPPEDGLYGRGLLYFEQWWKFRDIDVSVSGTLLSGVPAFIEKNTMRIINDKYSYFIPLEKVDYIRTNDGLDTALKRKQFNSI